MHHQDLVQACHAALAVPRDEARQRAEDFSWAHAARVFAGHLVPARRQPLPRMTVTKLSSGA